MLAQLLRYPSDLALNGGRTNRLLVLEDGHLLQHSLQALASVLQKCSTQKEALHVHTLICNSGVEANTLLGTYLVTSLAANDCIQYAQQVFDRLTYRTECSWTKLISGYYKCEKPYDALSVYSKMQTDVTVQPTTQTFVVLLQCCAKLKDLERGLELHAEVRKAGFLDGNLHVGSILVHMYGRCNSLAKAQHVIDNLPIRDVVIWTALIFAYSEHRFRNDTLRCFEQMKCEGVFPNAFTFASILKVCSGNRIADEVSKLHVEIETQGLVEEDLVIGNTLVDIYGKSGMFASAVTVFDKLPIRNIISWTALMSGFVDNEQYEEVHVFYQQMILEGLSPNPFTYVCCLEACGGLEATCRGQEMHMEIEKKGLLERNPYVGSSLVDCYSKSGLISEAKYVFDRVSAQDIIMWTALIGGYSQHGHGVEALKCFDEMQLDGTSPNAVTFAFVLEACKSLVARDRGQEIHVEIERGGLLGENFYLGNILIDMYFHFGMLARGHEVFDCLLCRNIVSWNTLIAGYAEAGHDEIAMHLYEDMNLQSVFPNTVTFYCILKVCSRLRAMSMGHVVHAEIEKRGILEDEVDIGGALVDMYGKCGLLEVARLVFDKLPAQGVASWTALIAGYTERGCNEDVLKCFDQMRSEKVSSNVTILDHCLKACGELGAIKRGFEIHAEIERQELLKTVDGIGNSLVNMYVECGLSGFAQEVIYRFLVQNMASATVLLSGYMEHLCNKEAFEESLSPDAYSYASNLKACSNVGVINAGLHAEIERKGLLEKNIFVGNTLMGMYTRSGQLTKARQVFDSLQVRDVVSWNVLISGYVRQEHFEEALECLEQLQLLGVCPDAITYLLSLKACSEVGDARKGTLLHMEIERQGLVGTDFHIGSALIEMYIKCGTLDKAEQVFNKFTARNLVLWNVLMEGYAQYGHAEETLKCLEEMQLEGVFPSTATYLSCLKACSTTGAINEGIELHAEIGRKELLEDVFIGNTLVDMYAKCGHLCMAQEVFDKLPFHDVVSWTTLIAGYARFGESECVFPVFDLMLKESIKPDPTIFIVVLGACKYTGLVNKSLSYFEMMSKDHGIDPTLDHNTCVIDMLGRAGQIDTAMELIRRMPCGPNLRLWDTLLAACRYWGDKKFGKIAFQHALCLDGKDAMAYVLMSYICGDVDMGVVTNKLEPL